MFSMWCTCVFLGWIQSRSLSIVTQWKQSKETTRKMAEKKAWRIFPRPLLETILNNHAQHHRVPQPLLLHGPRGVGKTTLILQRAFALSPSLSPNSLPLIRISRLSLLVLRFTTRLEQRPPSHRIRWLRGANESWPWPITRPVGFLVHLPAATPLRLPQNPWALPGIHGREGCPRRHHKLPTNIYYPQQMARPHHRAPPGAAEQVPCYGQGFPCRAMGAGRVGHVWAMHGCGGWSDFGIWGEEEWLVRWGGFLHEGIGCGTKAGEEGDRASARVEGQCHFSHESHRCVLQDFDTFLYWLAMLVVRVVVTSCWNWSFSGTLLVCFAKYSI